MGFYNNNHTKETSKIMKKKRKTNSLELLAGLSIFGPGTTNDIANFILRKQSRSSHPKISYREDTQPRQKIYYNLIHDRPRNEDKGKITGLISDGYIRQTGSKINEKKMDVPLFFLTQKGHFFSIGFKFDDKDFPNFLENASRNNLFFAYVNLIYKKTSSDFVTKIFITPIQDIIKKEKLDLDNEFNFYFVNIAESIGKSVHDEIDNITERYYGTREYTELLEPFDILIDNTFYVDTFSFEWKESLIEHFYPEDSENLEQEFFRRYRDDSDAQLLYAVFRSVYSAYYWARGFGIPRPRNKLPLPKWLKEHRKKKNMIIRKNKRLFIESV